MSHKITYLEESASGSIKVTLSGEIDILSTGELKEQLHHLIDTFKRDMVIDCSELQYIDSTGLGILVGALKKANEIDKQVSIVNLKENIRKLFLITGLDKVFAI